MEHASKYGFELGRYVVTKGSVCVDGVSLTVVEVKGDRLLGDTSLRLRSRPRPPDGPVWACVIAADAAIPDNPSSANQAQSADKANLF